jgi:hypothetical protein
MIVIWDWKKGEKLATTRLAHAERERERKKHFSSIKIKKPAHKTVKLRSHLKM